MKYVLSFLMGVLFVITWIATRTMFSEKFAQRMIEMISRARSDGDELRERRAKG